jgi:RNA polymerase sigma-70 factor (ECF subfamily)
VEDSEFEMMVNMYYEPLFRFALSLSQNQDDAFDLTQQTFYRWATKGNQLRDRSKAKTWLFTTLYREFLGTRRRAARFTYYELTAVNHELPTVSSKVIDETDGNLVMEALMEVEELYRAPLTLFYLESYSYKEIAEVLDVAIGTVMSRMSRGKDQLRQVLASKISVKNPKIVSLNSSSSQAR